MLIVLQGTIEEFVLANQDILGILMVQHVYQVRIIPLQCNPLDRLIVFSLLTLFSYLVPEPVVEDEGCKMDRECPSKQACIITNNKGECKNPCTTFQPCVQNAECKVYDSLPLRTMTCTCIEGFTGKGDELCQKISKLIFLKTKSLNANVLCTYYGTLKSFCHIFQFFSTKFFIFL